MWTDKQNVNILTNMHFPPAEGNFCDKHGNVPELAIAEDCNRYMEMFQNWPQLKTVIDTWGM
jgi:hypothetical protein